YTQVIDRSELDGGFAKPHSVPELLSDMGHQRMQQPEDGREDQVDHAEAIQTRQFLIALQFGLRGFEIPIAKIAPDEFVQQLRHLGEQITGVRVLDSVNGLVQAQQQPSRIGAEPVPRQSLGGRSLELPEPTCVPELVCEIPTLLDLLFIESDVLAVRRDSHQPKPETVGSILRNQVERIGRIPETFRHFAAPQIPDNSGEEHILKRHRSLVFEACHDHARNPEKNDVGPGYQVLRRVETLPRRLIHRGKRPQPSGEPGIQHVWILVPMFLICRRFRVDMDASWIVVMIPDGDSVTPPELTADAPILDMIDPMFEGFRPSFRAKPYPASGDRLK